MANNNMKRYVELTLAIKALEDEKAGLTKSLLLQIGDEAVDVEGYKLTKVTRRSVKLKNGVTVEEIMGKFPEAVDMKIDASKLGKIADAHEYLELSESKYLAVKKPKEA